MTLLICTAVTLYSGQLVAQSLLSVVITLAPETGWWNVVYTTPGFTPLGHVGAQHGVPDSAVDADPIAVVDAPFFGIMGMDF